MWHYRQIRCIFLNITICVQSTIYYLNKEIKLSMSTMSTSLPFAANVYMHQSERVLLLSKLNLISVLKQLFSLPFPPSLRYWITLVKVFFASVYFRTIISKDIGKENLAKTLPESNLKFFERFKKKIINGNRFGDYPDQRFRLNKASGVNMGDKECRA